MIRIRLIVINKKIKFLLLFTFFITVAAILVTVFYTQYSEPFIPADYVNSGIKDINENGGKLAIIIDDFGQNRRGVIEMMSIERHLTFAVMPFLTFSGTDAETAHEKSYEIIIHLPLEANAGKLSWVGPRPIMMQMKEEEVRDIVNEAFENIPYAVGANIHMGSKAGGDESIISIILDIINEKGLFFVDSRSCEHPIAKKIADSKGMPCLERNIFLDGSNKSKSYIKNQLAKSADIALKKGKAIAIGHVGTEGGVVTAEAISEMLDDFDQRNIQLVFVSELME